MTWAPTLFASAVRLPRPDAKWFVVGAAVALAAWLSLVPLGFLLWQSFLTPETATTPAQLTLDNCRTAYWSVESLRVSGNSVEFAAGSASLAFVVGTFFAWLNERTDTPFKSAFFALSLVPLIIPAILFTVSWILLASPKIGIINVAIQELFATDRVVANIYSMAGMIFVDGLHQSPLAFLMMTAAFRSSLDIYRPAAMEQLAVLGRDLDIPTLPIVAGQKPAQIAKRALEAAKLGGYDVVLLDTAGRTTLDEEMMAEAAGIKTAANPHEVLLVADSLTGQDAVNLARAFDARVGLTGIVLTRVDGDGRGGAALSMRGVTGQPSKLLGHRENTAAFADFQRSPLSS